MREVKTDIIIPVYRPGKDFARLLNMLDRQTLKPNWIIIINTAETEWDKENIQKLCDGYQRVLIKNIKKEDFNHGATRNEGVKLSDAEYFVCMTQDALPVDEHVIERLVGSLDNKVKISYARQIARNDANDIEKITREFNYPGESRIKTADDMKELGIKTFFASNVCCAYERKTFDELGGFIDKTEFNEDMMYASKLIRNGYAIKYCAEAEVYHSHNYTLLQQFKRNKAIAVSQTLHPEYFGDVKSEGEGIKLVKTSAGRLCEAGKWYLVPELILVSGCKYLGYLAGKAKH